MAFHQATFYLFAPGVEPHVESATNAHTHTGSAVSIVNAEEIDSTAPCVSVDDLTAWLVANGFREKERYGTTIVFWSAPVKTVFGTEPLVDVNFSNDTVLVYELRLRFLLIQNEVSNQWHDWRNLVCDLGDHFGFRLLSSANLLLPCIDFFTVLRENENFKAFKAQHGWNDPEL